MRRLRSAVFHVLFTLWTFGLAFVALPCLLDTRHLGGYAVGRLWGRGTAGLLKVCCGITHRIEGREHLPADGRMLVASKHQSAWETALFWPILHKPAYVLKKELLKLPLFGWYLTRLHNVAIDRSGGGKALKAMVAAAKVEAAQERPLVIFPEGTRNAYGSRGEYQPGVALLAAQLGLPVIPAALNSGACWGKGIFEKYPGVITLRFLPPIDPAGMNSRALLAAIESRIEETCAVLPAARA